MDYDDDWYDDEDRDWEGKTEPDCFGCTDSGYVEAKRGRVRPCPSCTPTRLDNLRWRIRSKLRDLGDWFRRRSPGYHEEAPF